MTWKALRQNSLRVKMRGSLGKDLSTRWRFGDAKIQIVHLLKNLCIQLVGKETKRIYTRGKARADCSLIWLRNKGPRHWKGNDLSRQPRSFMLAEVNIGTAEEEEHTSMTAPRLLVHRSMLGTVELE
jgi:hypothetical protein